MIFEPTLTGHHLEYLHHLHTGAAKHHQRNFVFAVPKSFDSVKDKFSWQEAQNIEFHFIDDVLLGSKLSTIRQLIRAYRTHHPAEIFFITIMCFMPILMLFSLTSVKLSGIIYNIYLYGWKTSSFASKAKNAILYALFTHCRCFKHIFILNDRSATAVLNKVWHTCKYVYLPDPFVPIASDNITNLRTQLGIDNGKKVFLHFGAMSARKGTLDVFRMIENTSTADLQNYCVIFAGKVGNDINQQFYTNYNRWKDKIQIIVEDAFVDYERIGSMLITCDAVLLPYKYVNLSSGVIGYCAQFGKPAIATSKGLIGKLVRKNKLGITIDDFNTLNGFDFTPHTNRYCIERTVDKFAQTIIALF